MGHPTTEATRKTALARALLAGILLSSTSACWFGGGQEEEKIDPNEATARDANYRTEAERARDERFKDRLQKRPRLDEPLKEPDR